MSANMINRTLKSLNKSLAECLENTNVWAIKTCELIKLKRSVLNNNCLDNKLYMIANAFSDAYYNDPLSSDLAYDANLIRPSDQNKTRKQSNHLDNTSSANRTNNDFDDYSDELNNTSDDNTDTMCNPFAHDVKVDDILRQEAFNIKKELDKKAIRNNMKNDRDNVRNKSGRKDKSDKNKTNNISNKNHRHAKSNNNKFDITDNSDTDNSILNNTKLTAFQKKSLQVLRMQEKETEEMNNYMLQRRKQMHQDMAKPPSSKVKFTLSTDTGTKAEPNSDGDVTIDEETVEETTDDTGDELDMSRGLNDYKQEIVKPVAPAKKENVAEKVTTKKVTTKKENVAEKVTTKKVTTSDVPEDGDVTIDEETVDDNSDVCSVTSSTNNDHNKNINKSSQIALPVPVNQPEPPVNQPEQLTTQSEPLTNTSNDREDNLADLVTELSQPNNSTVETANNLNSETANKLLSATMLTETTCTPKPAVSNTDDHLVKHTADHPLAHPTEHSIAHSVEGEMKTVANVSQPLVVFKTPDLEPPAINALTKLQPSERNKLLEKMFLKAKKNITELCPNKTKSELNKLIRVECDRLLQKYIEENA